MSLTNPVFGPEPQSRQPLGLPSSIWRIDNRVSRTLGAKPEAKLPIGHYLRENFYITTSGNFRTQTLTEVIMEVGADRILYSVDCPFEDTGIAGDWFDHCAISELDRRRLAGLMQPNCSEFNPPVPVMLFPVAHVGDPETTWPLINWR